MTRLLLAATAVALALVLPAPSQAASGLAGTSWVFERAEGRAVPVGYGATLAFHRRGRVDGRVDCNGIGGRYRRDGARLRFSRMLSTLIGCEWDGARPPDLLRVILRTRFHRRTAHGLTLLGARGRTLARLAPAP